MTQRPNVIADKSYAFSLRIVKCYQLLSQQHKEYVLSKQLLRAGTSVGANVAKAVGAQSRKDFRAKMSIAYKELQETIFFLRLLGGAGYLDGVLQQSLLQDCDELAKILGKIISTTVARLK